MKNDLLERYFEKTLSAKEEAEFLKSLESDPELKAEFEFRNSVKKAVARKELKGFLNEIETKKTSDKKPWIIGGVAASLLLAFGIWLSTINNPKKQIADAYFQTLPNMVNPTVRGENNVDLSKKAFEKYEAENFRLAIKEFEQLEKTPENLLYTGISYLANNDAEESVKILNSFATNDSTQNLETYRKWYLALAYLKDGQEDQAKKILKALSRYENPVQEHAREVLAKME